MITDLDSLLAEVRLIVEVETRYDLKPIRGARVADIEEARKVRAVSIQAYRTESERLLRQSGREDELQYLNEDIRLRAFHAFPFADAYTILTQLQLSRCANRGIVPLSDEMFPTDTNPTANVAWGYISQLERAHGLSNANWDRFGEWNTEPLRIIRLNMVAEYDNCTELQKAVSREAVKADITEYFEDADTFATIAEEIPPRSVYTI